MTERQSPLTGIAILDMDKFDLLVGQVAVVRLTLSRPAGFFLNEFLRHDHAIDPYTIAESAGFKKELGSLTVREGYERHFSRELLPILAAYNPAIIEPYYYRNHPRGASLTATSLVKYRRNQSYEVIDRRDELES